MKGIHGSSGGWQALDGERRVGPYRLVRELGRGCYGVVYEAERDGLGRRFALKVLTGQALRSPEAVARFEREARLASRIDDPGVVSVHDFGREGRFPYYVMDFVAGETLEDRIRRGRLDPIEAARLLAQLARTVAAAHEVNVIHRDLKPANVILDPRSRRPRITDFGLAQEAGAEGERLTRTGEAVGTPFYMAPEQNRGERDLDGRVDVYALGVILYQCLTQEVPYNGANFIEISKAIRSGPLTLPRQLVPELPAELE
ncbi:MAG TPA: serine/threonine protein kinase, partial [Planctomycetes bacterium]|nr:serine/threonine protein kinase [Planctomycetota bacterium]